MVCPARAGSRRRTDDNLGSHVILIQDWLAREFERYPPVTLAFSGDQHEHLRSFQFPGDGKDAVAVLLCGRRHDDRRHWLVVRDVHGIPL